MIEAFYNLKKNPFPKDINTKDIFNSDSSQELLRRLEYIKQKRGIMLVTGNAGTGKTLHARAFVDSLNQNMYKTFYLPLSTVNVRDFYSQLAFKLTGETYWKKYQLFEAIQTGIKDYVSNNKKVPVVIFDEVHLFKNENFYELQIITNFNMDSTDPALFILIGQPHIADRLLRPIHQSFNQRISLKFHLAPLSKNETSAYIKHHITLAGAKEPLFNENSIQALHQSSAGIHRVINKLAYKSLTIGALEKKHIITEEEVYRASKEV